MRQLDKMPNTLGIIYFDLIHEAEQFLVFVRREGFCLSLIIQKIIALPRCLGQSLIDFEKKL